MKKLIASLLIALLSSPAFATTYYVANAGSDSNNGTSTSTPWQTISKVNAGSFSAGDQILFNRGDLWREQLTNANGGSAGSHITYGAYGTGAKPSIRGSNLYNTAGNWTQATSSGTVTNAKPATGTDNGYYGIGDTGFSNTGNNLGMGGFDGSNSQDSPFARIVLNVPQGATISGATLTLRSNNAGNASQLNMVIRAEAADNPTAPTSNADAKARSLTTANVAWTITTWTNGSDFASPDISAVIQEVVNRAGWASGNHINIFVTSISSPTNIYRSAVSFQSSTTNCPRLNMSYSSSGGNNWYASSIANDPGVFVHDGTLGSRKTSLGALATQWDYFWDTGTSRLYVYSASNPTGLATNLEIAVRQNFWSQNGSDYVDFQDLDLEQFYGTTWVGFAAVHVNWTRVDWGKTATYGIQYSNGSQGAVTNSTFTDWGVVNGQQYAVQVIGFSGTASGPVDLIGNTFTINHSMNTTELGNMGDDNGWFRTVTGNTCVNNGNWPGSCIGQYYPQAGATSITFKNNSAYRMGSGGFGVTDLNHYGATPTTQLSYNYIEAADQKDVADTEALRVRNFSSSTPVVVSYNVIKGCASGSNQHAGIYLYGANAAKIYGNTISACDTGLLVKTASIGNDIRNNISTANRVYGIDVQDTSTVTTFNHNLFYNNTTANYHGISAGTGDVTTNPLLNSNLTLQAGSPAIGAGANLGSTYSLGLLPASVWPSGVILASQAPAWNIGAYVTPGGIDPFWFSIP